MCKDHKKVKPSVRKMSLEQDTLAHLHPGRLSFIAAPAGRSRSDISSAGVAGTVKAAVVLPASSIHGKRYLQTCQIHLRSTLMDRHF